MAMFSTTLGTLNSYVVFSLKFGLNTFAKNTCSCKSAPARTLSTQVARGLHKCTNIEYYLSFSLLSHGIQLSPRTEIHSIPLITLRNHVLTPKPSAPCLSLRMRATKPRGPRPGLPRSHPMGQNGQVRKRKDKDKGYARTETRKQIWWFRHRGSTVIFIDAKKLFTRGHTHKT